MTESHELWLRQIDAELDGELSLIERSALAKHLASCSHCSGARASQLEVRVAATLLLALQAPGTRLTYRVAVVERVGTDSHVVARGSVSGGLDTDLRLALRTDSADIEALFQVTAEAGEDTLTLGAEFFTKRRLGRSRRGLPLWEQDNYRRVVRLAWSDTARIHPFGRPRPDAPRGLWIELVPERGFAGGEARPGEELHVADPAIDVRLEAVVRPRRARVIFNLVRGDTVSAPVGLDLVPDAPPRRLQLVLAGRRTALEVGLARPEPAASARDRVLALDADVVCLRVGLAGAALPVGVLCGRLNNVARRLPLFASDTLLATFVWPGGR